MPSPTDMKKNIAYKVALGGILCAEAIALSFLEGLIPAVPWLPPGAKPGFSNIITMFAAGFLGLPRALTIAVVKSAFVFVTRGATAGAMSLSGGILSTLAMFFLLKYGRKIFGLTGISVICALCHNFGQLMTSVLITGTAKTFYYAPFLAISGIIAGILTGFIFKALLPAMEKQKKFFYKV